MTSRKEAISRQLQSGGKVIAVFPGRYPRALLEAHGLLPVEVWDPPEGTGAGAHLQVFVCQIAHRGLELVLNGPDEVSGLLFPHTCDSLQNLFTVVRDFVKPGVPCLMFYPPRGAPTEASRKYVEAAVRKLGAELGEAFGIGPEPAGLTAAVDARGEALAALREMYARRAGPGLGAGNAEFYDVVRRWEYLPSADFAREATDFLAADEGVKAEGGVRLVLSGVFPDRGLLALLDSLGVEVCEDDLLACGRRFARDGASSLGGDDPWAIMADWLTGLPPCSSMGSPLEDRGEFIVDLVARSRARAVLFHTPKFCEPELFDHPFLVARLKEKTVPVHVIETELHPPAGGQLATRLEAFLEMLA